MSSPEDPPGLLISRATARDAQALADLGERTFREAFEEQNDPEDFAAYLASAFRVEKIRDELEDPGSTFHLARFDGRPVGYSKLRRGKEQESVRGPSPVELERIYVERATYGRGVGAALMRNALDAARDAGFRTIWLGVWQENPRALAFYAKWGFEKAGTHEFVVGSDVQTDWVLVRPLSGV